MTTRKQYKYSKAINDLQGGFSILMLRKTETELLAEVFRRSGFRSTAAISGLKNRWDIIYKALLHSEMRTISLPTRGKAIKSLDLPQSVIDILISNKISIRMWANAYHVSEKQVISEMQSMARMEEGYFDYSDYIHADFPVLSKKKANSISMPPQIYIRGDIVIRQGYGKDRIAIARMDTGIEVKGAGKSTEEAEYVLKTKARTLTRLSCLYHYIYGGFPRLEDLVELVDEPYFAIPEDIQRYRAEKKNDFTGDFGSFLRANQ
jgi:hypothetical protein